MPNPLHWDIFCRVVDNLGDIGVCWRLSADLASRGQRVRLWIDQPEPLRWMAPGALEGDIHSVEVIAWTTPMAHAAMAGWTPGEVWVEAFGCDPAPECVQRLADQIAEGSPAPVWINLEYLSAEPYVERSHRLPSPVMSGPLKGLTKWFFYPGFTTATGGLLRESDRAEQQAAFDAAVWLRGQGLASTAPRRVSLFCYEPPVLAEVLRALGLRSQSGARRRLAGARALGRPTVCVADLSPARQRAPRQARGVPRLAGGARFAALFSPAMERHRQRRRRRVARLGGG